MPDQLHLPFRPGKDVPLPVKNFAAAAWYFQRGGDAELREDFLPFMPLEHGGRAEAEDENDSECAEESGDDL